MAPRNGVAAYPLKWPQGWKRVEKPIESSFKVTTSKAHSEMLAEISRMGGTQVVISSNCPLNEKGVMRMDREPVDTGVAVYFQRDGKSVVFASDKYDLVAHNLRAIGVTIEALRTIERHGTSELTDRAFLGFKALEAENPGMSWWKTLQVYPEATEEQIQAAYRSLAKLAHKDAGGSDAAMTALNVARDQALAARKSLGT